MIVKVIGVILALIGFLMLKFFPSSTTYQPDGFARSGVLIGLIMFVAGIILIIFGE